MNFLVESFMTRFISFNVNGIRARQHQLEAIKEQLDPDVMGLQEIKVHDEQFPLADVESRGWHVEHFGSAFRRSSCEKCFEGDHVVQPLVYRVCRLFVVYARYDSQ